MNSEYSPDPLDLFHAWFERGGTEAVALATASKDGAPSIRMVLLRRADERGFVFFTGYESRKGRELAENPQAALLFYWPEEGRQVRIEGAVERVGDDESESYWTTRPRGSQLAAWASIQSRVLPSRDALDERFRELEAEYEGREVPLPAHWGGYRLVPETYEFWTHRENRLHDRLHYRRDGDNWVAELLSP
jgi:pyridoxamine 5'-phosphate oxidase